MSVMAPYKACAMCANPVTACAQYPEAVNVGEWFAAFCAVHSPGAPDPPDPVPAPADRPAATKPLCRRARPSKRVMPVKSRVKVHAWDLEPKPSHFVLRIELVTAAGVTPADSTETWVITVPALVQLCMLNQEYASCGRMRSPA